ncbi:PREDICTED: CDT1-like protein a, chloroplastic [Nicotiana attenuata]|uniref:Cdt1-like protein a, chloroplastic n=1 Tax=Nicotiana attenuata TaxID=49451 RepID=A0A1J6JB28_NICAT|nr:PREDICTED: CDT1-like protein a, chloroplastic [Nicotiana attenuata]OIT06911.1 cdt1-like protein a, chloroplastic [Nicotiana attenuata]
MESDDSSSLLGTFKSKKKLQMGSDPVVSGAPSLDPWSSKTPEKPIIPPRRTRNRGAALSLKEVRQATQRLRKPDPNHPIAQAGASLSSVKSPAVKAKKPIDPVKLPEKYELLEEFFRSLNNSIRLLRLKGSSTTFTNISTKVECLTDRRFTYTHLAQLKFLLPEAIEIKKILVHDEHTYCMKPDLHITLNANAVEVDEKLKSTSGTVQLEKVFRARILDFFKSHPEGDDIPEEALPGAFGGSKQELLTNSSTPPAVAQLMGETPIASMQKQATAASHLSQSFRKSFSHRASIAKAEDTEQLQTVPRSSLRPVSEPQISKTSTESHTSTSADKTASKLLSTQTSRAKCSARGVISGTSPPSPLPATPLKNMKGGDGSSLLSAEETPAKHTSTPAKLMTSTPVLQPSKRCYMSPDGELTESPQKLVRRPPRIRSLTFDTPVKSSKVTEVIDSRESSIDDEFFDILPQNLLQSIRKKEQKALEDKDPAISQAKWHQKMISSLPKFFDMIYFLFQSIKRSVITKEELMHKVLSSHLEITDRREVEEQLRLLLKIAPEWIHEKVASSGDRLLCVSEVSNAESIRTRIAEAN